MRRRPVQAIDFAVTVTIGAGLATTAAVSAAPTPNSNAELSLVAYATPKDAYAKYRFKQR